MESIEIQCKDGIMQTEMYALMYCFRYFEKLFTVKMKKPEKPVLEFSCRTLSIALEYGFYDRLRDVKKSENITFSDIPEIYACIDFLEFKQSISDFITHMILISAETSAETSMDKYDAEITDIIIKCKISNIEKLLPKMSPENIVKIFASGHVDIGYKVDKLHDEKIYQIYKLSNTSYLSMYSIKCISRMFTVEDFIYEFNDLANGLKDLNHDHFICFIKLLNGCKHLSRAPELKKHWKFLYAIDNGF
jgi:hypothetical protein